MKRETGIFRIDLPVVVSKNDPDRKRNLWIEYSYLEACGGIHVWETDFLTRSVGIASIMEYDCVEGFKNREDILRIQHNRPFSPDVCALFTSGSDAVYFISSNRPISTKIKSIPEGHRRIPEGLNGLIVYIEANLVTAEYSMEIAP